MKCKTCGAVFLSLLDHVHHFNLHHRVSIHSLFTCGVNNCIVKVKNEEGYQQHFKLCHRQEQNNDVMYKCPFPDCNYKAKSKATLRSHKFWHGDVSVEGHNHVSPSEEISTELDCIPPLQHPATAEVESCSASSFDCSASEDSLAKKFTHMSLSLTSKYHVPDSTLAFVLENYATLLQESSAITSRKVINEVKNQTVIDSKKLLEVLSEDPLLKLHSSEGPLRSYYCRNKEYGKQFPFVKPRQVRLGLNDENVECKYHYVPLKESLKLMFEDDTVYDQYLFNRSRRSVQVSSDLSDIHSGSVYYESKLFSQHSNSIEIILFQDDIELVKALGSAAGSYKMMHMGFTIGNLHPWNRSKVDPLQLLLLCKEKDVAYFGLPRVLEPVMEDLKDLEINGVEIRGELVKATVLVLLGDNLGTHTIGGFVESFSTSKFFCRYCEESREEWNARWDVQGECSESETDTDSDDSETDSDSEDENDSVPDSDEDISSDEDLIPLAELRKRWPKKSHLRTVESYNGCLAELAKGDQHNVKGVVANCELNKLQHFHVVGGSPPCLPHDIFEGFARYDLQMILVRLSTQFKFSLTTINRKLSQFEFKDKDKLDKPPRKLAQKGKQVKRVKGNAVQVWTLLRFLPLLLCDLVTDKKNPAWVMLLLLIEVVQLITSPIIARSCNNYIDEQIVKYLTLRSQIFEAPLRPKHHFWEHYAQLILRYGPLMRCSTLRFESKHKFFRSEFCNKKCLKNPTKSIATAHQRLQSALHIEDMFARHPIMKEASPLSRLDVDKEIIECLKSSFGTSVASKLLFSSEITYHNTVYKKGVIVVISGRKHLDIECLKIELLVSDGTLAYALGV